MNSIEAKLIAFRFTVLPQQSPQLRSYHNQWSLGYYRDLYTDNKC